MPKGRFAPSPTGRMHLGNVYAALLSWLSAKSKGGEWLLRIEDIDPGRSKKEYADQMMESEGLQKGGTWQKFLSDYVEMDEDHPFTSTRVKELLRWGNGPLFAKAIEVVQHKLLS